MTDTKKKNTKDERTDRQDEAAPLPGIPHPAHHARLVGWPLKAFQEKLLKRARKGPAKALPASYLWKRSDRILKHWQYAQLTAR
jgi:hypothetical protein